MCFKEGSDLNYSQSWGSRLERRCSKGREWKPGWGQKWERWRGGAGLEIYLGGTIYTTGDWQSVWSEGEDRVAGCVSAMIELALPNAVKIVGIREEKNWVWEMMLEVVPMGTHSLDLGAHFILDAPLWVLDSCFQRRLGLKWVRNLPKVTLRKYWRCNWNAGISANHNANYLHQGNSGGINMILFEPAEIWGTWRISR